MKTLNYLSLASALCVLANFQYALASCSSQYDFNINTETIFNYSQIKSQGQRTYINLSGQLTIKEAQYENEHGWWAIKADNVSSGSGDVTSELKKYTIPFAFKLTEEGIISEFWFSTLLSEQEQEQLKGLAYYFQFQRNSKQLSLLEQDTLGKYEVTYAFEGDTIELKKQTYKLPQKKGDALQTIQVDSSEHKIVPKGCFFSQRKGEESLIFNAKLNSLNLKVTQNSNFTLTNDLYPSLLFSLPIELDNWPKSNKTLTEAELSELKKALKRLVLENDLTLLPAYQLAQKLSEFDAVISTLGDVFLDGKMTNNEQMRLFNALGLLDSANSQLILGRILIEAEKDPLMQFRALRALSQGQNPLSYELTSVLKTQIEIGFSSLDSEVTSSFYMTMGAMLNGRKPNQQSQQLHIALSEQLALETNSATQSALITGLGNSRDEQHFAQIDSFVNDTNKRVQSATYRALGMLQTPQAYESLEKQLSKQTDNIQQSLINALGQYQLKPSASEAMLSIAVNNPNEKSRYAAIKALANQNNQTDVKQTLKAALRSETSRRNFKAIVELIHNTEQSPVE